jgi:hypothetical protein
MSRSVKHQAEPMWGKHQAGQDTQGFRLLTYDRFNHMIAGVLPAFY